mmetsp:Transcript_9149/g.55564  ORF Transcript_9149/g.55564 Transcript_9149/m.55564 type:complete len:257 (+) Transcript_9149:46-816(+)
MVNHAWVHDCPVRRRSPDVARDVGDLAVTLECQDLCGRFVRERDAIAHGNSHRIHGVRFAKLLPGAIEEGGGLVEVLDVCTFLLECLQFTITCTIQQRCKDSCRNVGNIKSNGHWMPVRIHLQSPLARVQEFLLQQLRFLCVFLPRLVLFRIVNNTHFYPVYFGRLLVRLQFFESLPCFFRSLPFLLVPLLPRFSFLSQSIFTVLLQGSFFKIDLSEPVGAPTTSEKAFLHETRDAVEILAFQEIFLLRIGGAHEV